MAARPGLAMVGARVKSVTFGNEENDMQTIVEKAQAGEITAEIRQLAQAEGLEPLEVRERIAAGQIVVPLNSNRPSRLVGIGKGLKTKVNASIGTSTDLCDIGAEVAKALAAQEAGADTLMELSVGGDLDQVRRQVLAAVDLPVGNVPLYQAFCEAQSKYGDPNKLSEEMLFDIIERQCADGISFMAIHCGINRETILRLERQGYRYGGLVSKGGASMVAWMVNNNRENPLYEKFERVVAILKKYDVVLSLGNGFRAGALADSSDRAMIQELVINCELAEMGRRQGCQMMVEGPGHVPLDEIEGNIMLEKRMSGNAPYYVLGPLPADSGAGYDHITAAIGAASAARYGADLICYITPAEHLALPNEADVREGVRATRLAARIGDLAKYPERREHEKKVALSRRDMRWDEHLGLLMFPDKAREVRAGRTPADGQTCTMCGDFCAMRQGAALFAGDLKGDKIAGSAKNTLPTT